MNLDLEHCLRCGSPLDEKLHCAGTPVLGSCGWTMPAWMLRDALEGNDDTGK